MLFTSGGVSTDRKTERWRDFLRYIAEEEVDLVLVNELWGAIWWPFKKWWYLYSAYKAGYNVAFSKIGTLSDSGLAVLSKYPIQSSHEYRYSLGGLPWKNMMFHCSVGSNGVLSADIELGCELAVSVFTTHMIHCMSADPTSASVIGEVRQTYLANVHELNGVVKKHTAAGMAIITGDFNLSPKNQCDSKLWDALQYQWTHHGTDLATMCSSFLTPPSSFLGWHEYVKKMESAKDGGAEYEVDHVFSSLPPKGPLIALTPSKVIATQLSDHHFIMFGIERSQLSYMHDYDHAKYH